MSCEHGNWPPCDECDALEAAYKRGYEAGIKASPPTSASDAEVEAVVDELQDLAGYSFNAECCNSTFPISQLRRVCKQAANLLPRSPARVGWESNGGMALEIAYTEARVWKVEAMAARKLCAECNELAKADGYGGGSVRAHDILEAMDTARAAHEEREAQALAQQASGQQS